MATRMREKAAKRAEEKDLRPRAVAKYIRMSPYKVRQVLDIIRGKDYLEAVSLLSATPRAAAPVVKKLINSAAANAENNLNLSLDDLMIAEIFADQGPSLKRMQPRARGSAFRIVKRTSHITVVLDIKEKTSEVKAKAKRPQKASATKAKASAAKTKAPTAKAKPVVKAASSAKPAAAKPKATEVKPKTTETKPKATEVKPKATEAKPKTATAKSKEDKKNVQE